jgi:hypothetical protein
MNVDVDVQGQLNVNVNVQGQLNVNVNVIKQCLLVDPYLHTAIAAFLYQIQQHLQ